MMITELSKNGYTTILIDTMEDDAMLARGVKTLLSRQVEGIIAVPCGDDGAILEMVDKEIPVVLVDRYCEESNLPYVASNNYQGGLDGTRRLISAGHKRIACIQGVVSSTPNKERVHGYLDALKEAGIKDGIIVGNAFSIQNGYLETKLLLGENELPTAIFALSNTILMGAYKAIRESGLRIPEDISLLSFDDNIYMDYLTPPIERMSQPVGDMAVLAVKILMDRIAGIPRSEKRIRLSPTIIHGGSIAAPKA